MGVFGEGIWITNRIWVKCGMTHFSTLYIHIHTCRIRNRKKSSVITFVINMLKSGISPVLDSPELI